jgi:predicted AlkP superfamily pyrophosphatase or phosphodiesterase
MKKFGRWGIRLFAVCLAIGWSLTASYYKRASVTAYSNKVDKNYVVVISIDALNARDFDTMKELPNFKKLIENGSYARKVIGVYPSLTYPSHVSIMTGSYPDKHGIVNNKKNEIGVKTPGWYWYSKDIKIPTVYDLAKEKNLTVGALAWPVTAGANIDYNYPEIWTTKPEEDEAGQISQNGTSDFVKFIRKSFGSKLKERQQPELDNFITDSAVYMVKNKKPNLALIHLGELDSKRHGNGADSSIV